MTWQSFAPIVERFSPDERARIRHAYEMGESSHAGQKRKSGEPYFMHPIAVASMLSDLEADSDTIIAALLHDTVEDTPLTLDTILQAFGSDVAGLIDGVTKLEAEDLPKSPTVDAQIETLRKMFTLLQQDVRIMIIKLVDRLHNMRTIEHLPIDRATALARETIDVYAKIADRLCMQDLRDDLEELSFAVLKPQLAAALHTLRERNAIEGKEIAKTMEQELREHMPQEIAFSTHFEHKHWQKLEIQHLLGGSTATGVSAYTVVFVTQDIDACYRLLGALHGFWARETLSFQDFIHAPRINGYRGVHTTIILPNGTRVRCKMRTQEMETYARWGVSTRCFDQKAAGVIDYLPWAKRISSLSRDTADRSKEFFENLQSDILQESMVIHGPGDETILVPLHSTALDGAFHLFGEQALKMKRILINGQEAPFNAPLAHAVTLEIEWEDRQTVERHWLEWANTGLAVARIRGALSAQSNKKKITFGEQLLRQHLLSHKKGFIEEFHEDAIRAALQSVGYISLKDVYIAIADGRLQLPDVYRALFESRGGKASEGKETVIVKVTFPLGDLGTISNLVRTYQRHHDAFRKIRLGYNPLTGKGLLRIHMLLDPGHVHSFLVEVQSAGNATVELVAEGTNRLMYSLKIGALMFVWGFDPVVAYWLIHNHAVGPIDLTIVRFASLSVISALLLALQRHNSPLPETRIALRNFGLWLSVLLLFAISLTTYTSLENTSPNFYTIPMTSAGIVLTTIVNRKRRLLLGTTWLLLLLGIGLLVTSDQWNNQGIIFTLLAVGSFSAFSIVSERYKREEHIGARAAQYFFILSVLCMLLTLPLLPFSAITQIRLPILMQMIGFSVVFAGLPYYIYYYLLTHRQLDFVLRYSFLIIFTTGVGQLLLLPELPLTGITLAASGFVILGALLPLLIPRFLKGREPLSSVG